MERSRWALWSNLVHRAAWKPNEMLENQEIRLIEHVGLMNLGGAVDYEVA